MRVIFNIAVSLVVMVVLGVFMAIFAPADPKDKHDDN